METIEHRTMRKVYLRLLPFCFCLYLICYLDRANIGFAALTMNKDLGLSSYVYGLGAGAFFWGYFLLEVPSNLILERVGARKWIARIMISWGIVSGCFAFVEGPVSFFTLRFLSGPGRGRLFPRHDPVFHLLVPALSPRPRDRRLHGGHPGRDRHGRTGVDGIAWTGWHAGTRGLEVAVHFEAMPAVILGFAFGSILTDRPGERRLARGRRTQLAHLGAWRRSNARSTPKSTSRSGRA